MSFRIIAATAVSACLLSFSIFLPPKAVFSRLTRTVVDGIPNIYHYFEDVIIATEIWEHVHTLRRFFQQVKNPCLTIKPSKSEVGFTSVKFLGHIVGHDSLHPQIKALEKIEVAKKPTTKREVRSFLGLTGYYQDFVPNYSKVSAPPAELTRKRTPNKLVWEPRHSEAFDELQRLLSEQPILRSPDLEQPFILHTNTSSTNLMAVLPHRHGGVMHPVAYASRKPLPTEARYSTIERESLAQAWAIQNFLISMASASCYKLTMNHSYTLTPPSM